MRKVKAKLRNALANKFALSSMEESLSKFLPSQLDILIDVGANQGNFTKVLRSLNPVRQVYFCEANTNCISILEKNKLHHDVIIPKIISDKVGEENFYIYSAESTSSMFSFENNMDEITELNTKAKEIKTIPSISIDNLIKEYNIKEIDLLKIDVQGAELKVLEGSKSSFSKIKNIWVEVSMKKIYQNSPVFSEVYEYLNQHGFIFKSFSPVFKSKNGEILQADVLFTRVNE